MEQHLKYIADKIREIEAYAAEAHSRLWWESYLKGIEKKVNEVTAYANKYNIPIILDAEAIAERNYKGDKYEEDYYEESSSYYEEDESYYEEDDDDEEKYEESSYF